MTVCSCPSASPTVVGAPMHSADHEHAREAVRECTRCTAGCHPAGLDVGCPESSQRSLAASFVRRIIQVAIRYGGKVVTGQRRYEGLLLDLMGVLTSDL